MSTMYNEFYVKDLEAKFKALQDAIRIHRSQKADDRCIEDDDRLYAALGDGIKCDRQVGSKEAMLRNCARFVENRCQGGKWPSYAELEKERDDLRRKLHDKSVENANLARAMTIADGVAARASAAHRDELTKLKETTLGEIVGRLEELERTLGSLNDRTIGSMLFG